MSKRAVTCVAAIAALGAVPSYAQDNPTAEEMVEVARELYRPPGMRRTCDPGAPGEIVVCARDDKDFRVSSPTEDAIAAGEAIDPVPRAPDLFGQAPGVVVARGCFIPPCPPPMPPIVDFAAIPDALTPDEAARVFRAPDPANPAAASPAEAR